MDSSSWRSGARVAERALGCRVGLGVVLALLLGAGCYKPVHPAEEIASFPVKDLEGVVTMPGDGVFLDVENSFDGNGSLFVAATGKSVIVLYDVEDLDVENAILSYQARVKTKDATGPVFIELRVNIPGMGTYQSTADDYALTGTTDWVMQEANFWLEPDQVPSRLYLMIHIEERGMVWIDDLRVLKTPRGA